MTPQNLSFPTPPVLPSSEENTIISPEQLLAKTVPVAPSPTTEAATKITPQQLKKNPLQEKESSGVIQDKSFGVFTKDKKDNNNFFTMHTITAATGGLVFFVIAIIFFFLARINIW